MIILAILMLKKQRLSTESFQCKLSRHSRDHTANQARAICILSSEEFFWPGKTFLF